jgi:CubicO group peptidase (beta-lactamase class C family)
LEALRQIDAWGAGHAAAGLARAEGVVATHGHVDEPLRWASVTKLVTALATLVAAEEGTVDLDEPAGPEGSTVRHLLAHASGLPFEGEVPIARPGQRRIYSNTGFEQLAEHVGATAGIPFARYAREAVLRPLEVRVELDGPAAGMVGTLVEMLVLAQELLAPTVVARETLAEATSVQFPGLAGVLPGIGRLEPNDWGLGFELKDAKSPHWTGSANSSGTFGHFGGSGTFLWIDRERRLALACLTDREFGDWALQAWPKLSDQVLAEVGA